MITFRKALLSVLGTLRGWIVSPLPPVVGHKPEELERWANEGGH